MPNKPRPKGPSRNKKSTTSAKRKRPGTNPFPTGPKRVPFAVGWDMGTWMEFFGSVIIDLIDPEAAPEKNLAMVGQARNLADKALDEVHDRWAGIRT